MTKKVNNVYDEICSRENIHLAYKKAIKGKSNYEQVKEYKKNRKAFEERTRYRLLNMDFDIEIIKVMFKETDSGKIRKIPIIGLLQDQVIQHCFLNVISKKWDKSYTDDCYNCIKNRGINSKVKKWNLNHKVKRAINEMHNKNMTIYVGKWDIAHHYNTVKNSVLKKAYYHDCKDKKLLKLLDTINYTTKGIPIGWTTGSPSSHIILRRLDHWIKEELKIKYYFRFADDMVILHNDKKQIHEWMWRIRNFLWYELKQEFKGNYKVFPITEGIDFGGYVYKENYTIVRKSIKKNAAKKRNNPKSVTSYLGIFKYCNSKNLIKKIFIENNKHMSTIKDLGIKIDRRFSGKKISMDKIEGEKIKILDFEVRDSIKKNDSLWLRMQIEYKGEKRFLKSSAQYLAKFLTKVDKNQLPLEDVVICHDDDGYYFEDSIND